MGLTIAKLTAGTRSFVWHFAGEDVPITYRPGVLTYDWAENTEIGIALEQALVSIDITNGSGKRIKTDSATLMKSIPIPILKKISQAIYDDAGVDPTTAETSAGS